MNSIDDLLDRGFDELAGKAPHDADLAGTIRRRSRYRRMVTIAPIAAVVAVLAVIGAVVLIRPPAAGPAARPASACGPVEVSVLPTWARAGFSDPVPRAAYITSRSGHVVAILFTNPLAAPPVAGQGNKILWVADNASGGDDLVIDGRLEGGSATMHTTVAGGPGPSGVDVPTAGCWVFTLTYGTHHDVIDIPYSAP
ncbi:hypothetical protein SAMN04515671_1422 [Nakamurella panacisegetis]|uniref:Uncharacterized protein n=1 Tax=Nakamurella panacisegetis TaxID=1090615 RepID=A0A1H0KTJ4_9ACTN|nr:hypothetical protein [Nakamurella panacisegetis]SDO59106.1 hypothetical protein SAMN04515671_1422 [Nakamurella panacisegetis]